MYSGYNDDGTPGWGIIEPYLREYERLNPHIRIENLGREHEMDKLLTLFAAGEAPDIVEGGTHHIFELYAKGLLAEVPSAFADALRAEMFPVSIASLEVDGRLFGVPIENMSTGIMYNKPLLAESGMTEPATTVAEFEQMGRRLLRMAGDGTMLRPGVADPGEGWTLHYH